MNASYIKYVSCKKPTGKLESMHSLIKIFIFCLFILVLHTNVSAQPYTYWPSYNQIPIRDINQVPWVASDNVDDGWDWSLPDNITPAQTSKLIFARSISLDDSRIKDFPIVTFPCNPVVTHWIGWNLLEPTEDNYDWDGLRYVIDLCTAKGYKSVLRFMTCRVERSAPGWFANEGIKTITHSNGEIDYDPTDPVYHQHYLDLIADFGASGIQNRDDVVGLYVGYSSKSWGDEGIGPGSESNPASNDTEIVKERLDAWATITDGIRHKVVMGGYSNHGFNLGFGIRRGFVEHYMYHIPDDIIGQKVDPNGYLYVDETNSFIANNAYNGDENEAYNESYIDDGRFGNSLTAFPYRYFSANIRLLQMRCNAVLYNPFALMPEMLAWVGLELGRTRDDAPDTWCFLRESKLNSGPVKNFERWLYQRDTPGYETQAVISIDKNYNSWMYDANKPYDYIARKGAKIGFAADDVVFPTNVEHKVAIKVSYIDNVVGTLKLVYHNNSGPQQKTINTTGGDVVRTATFFVTAKFDASGFNYDFELQSETGKEVPVSFVRVIKTDIVQAPSQAPYGGSNRSIPGLIEAEHYDVGGEGLAYHDDDLKEGDINFRPGDFVDVKANAYASNDSVVCFINDGEWLEYTVDAEAGRYDITLFYFSGVTGGDVVVSLYGEILDTINGFGKQGLDVRDSITVENILLPEGGKDKVLRLEFINNPAFDIDAIKFTSLFTPVTGISLNSCPLDTLLAGDTYQLTANVEPWYANNSTLTWESSDEAIASVDSTGMVTAISDGTASITITTNEGGYFEICNIAVQIKIISVYGATIGGCPWSILQTGDTHQLTANVAPENATDRSHTWKSSNPEVASVDENGLVSALSQGSVKITISTNDGAYTNTCSIGVMGNATSADYDEHINNRIKIYPNPVSEILYFNFPESTSEKSIKIYNSNGKLLIDVNTYNNYLALDVKKINANQLLLINIVYGKNTSSFKVYR
jgi:hypothetical protein